MKNIVKKEALELVSTFKTGELESRLRWLIENGYIVRIDYGRYMRILNNIEKQEKIEIPNQFIHIKNEVGLIRKFWRWIY